MKTQSIIESNQRAQWAYDQAHEVYGLLNTKTGRIQFTTWTAHMLATAKKLFASDQDRPFLRMVRLNSNLDRHINGKIFQRHYYPGLKRIK